MILTQAIELYLTELETRQSSKEHIINARWFLFQYSLSNRSGRTPSPCAARREKDKGRKVKDGTGVHKGGRGDYRP